MERVNQIIKHPLYVEYLQKNKEHEKAVYKSGFQ